MALSAMVETFGTKYWDFDPIAFQVYKNIIDNAILTRESFAKDDTPKGLPYLTNAASGFSDKVYAGNAAYISWSEDLDETDIVVNVLAVEGPILRNGDACSYGSKNYRDWLITASELPQCVGHVIYINTPGGSSFSKNDFKYAIDLVREKGQPVIALVDGVCASAGMALAALCDEIYYVNPMDQIGCIGTLCAFYATEDGALNAVTQQRYVEVYSAESPFKNKEYRDAAKGDYAELQAEVDKLNIQFQELVREYRPQVTEEQLTGRLYNCGDVVGTLTDGQSTLTGCIEHVLQLADVELAPLPTQAETDNDGSDSNREDDKSENNHLNNNLTMKEYPKLMEALGLNDLCIDKENGVYLHEDLCDKLEESLATACQNKEVKNAKIQEVTRLNEKINELGEQHKQDMENLKADHSAAIELLKQEHAKELKEKDSLHLQEVGRLNAKVQEQEKELKDKEGEIKQLSEATAPAPVPAAPESNEVTAGTSQEANPYRAITNPYASNKEKARQLSERMKMLNEITGNN